MKTSTGNNPLGVLSEEEKLDVLYKGILALSLTLDDGNILEVKLGLLRLLAILRAEIEA
jgi:hypothetical protein